MEHAVIPDNQRHEAKGASTAAAGQVCRSNGNGTTSFQFLSYNDLTNKPTVTGYRRVLVGSSSATSQGPVAVNTPVQIEFGSGTATADATLDNTGALTFNTAGTYQVTQFFRFGRTSASGLSIIFSRLLLNGSQVLNSNSVMLDNASTIIPFSATVTITATAGQVLTTQLYRDSTGINNGGLLAQTPSLAGWNISPTATLVVDKFVGISA